MSTEERAHIQSLLQLHRAHLRELELKAAKYGDLDVPTHVTLQIAQYRQKIAELEERMHENLPRHNLPQRDYEQFIGRQKELADVRKLLLPYPKSRYHLVTIDGIGGIGKSALALETAYTFVDQYAALPDSERFEAIVWVSAKRSYLTADGILERRQVFRTLDDLYAAIAQVFDYPAIVRARAEEQPAIVEAVLREQRTLLILDNLETVDDEELLAFLHELPDPAKAMVTTRHRIDVARPVRLTGMPHEDALELIIQEAVRKGVALTSEEHEELWDRTGGVPLAIVWSIGLMGLGGSVESVLRRLGSGQSDIARFCFEESVAQIRGRDAHKLLLSLSLFATDASRDSLGVVAGLGEDEFGRDTGLEDLLRLSLVNKESERFGLLPLTKTFVQSETATNAAWMNQANERLAGYFYDLAKKYGRWSNEEADMDKLEPDLVNILPVLDLLASRLEYHRDDDLNLLINPGSVAQAKMLLEFIANVSKTCRLRGYWRECERLLQQEIMISRSMRDVWRLGAANYTLARISYYRDDIASAKQYAVQALTAWEREDDNHGKSVCKVIRLLGLIALRKGEIEEARKLLTDAMNRYEKLDGFSSRQNFYETMGELAEREDDNEAAFSWYERSTKQARQLNDLAYVASGQVGLGRVALTRGDFVSASQYCEESVGVAQQSRRVDILAKAFHTLAILRVAQNQPQSAATQARQALDLFRRLGMKREQAEAETLLARINSEASSS